MHKTTRRWMGYGAVVGMIVIGGAGDVQAQVDHFFELHADQTVAPDVRVIVIRNTATEECSLIVTHLFPPAQPALAIRPMACEPPAPPVDGDPTGPDPPCPDCDPAVPPDSDPPLATVTTDPPPVERGIWEGKINNRVVGDPPRRRVPRR